MFYPSHETPTNQNRLLLCLPTVASNRDSGSTQMILTDCDPHTERITNGDSDQFEDMEINKELRGCLDAQKWVKVRKWVVGFFSFVK